MRWTVKITPETITTLRGSYASYEVDYLNGILKEGIEIFIGRLIMEGLLSDTTDYRHYHHGE